MARIQSHVSVTNNGRKQIEFCKYFHFNSAHPKHFVPDNAITGGYLANGTLLYIGKAYYNGDILPARIDHSNQSASVSYAYHEHIMHDYQFICQENVSWIPAADGEVPNTAICVGHTIQNEPLFVGRVLHEECLLPGKIHQSHRVLYIGFNGREIPYSNYEVLCE